ncbi:1168_t:CDS:2 [Funneliformis caledonium]|uniref:1168_t:CDS:1 n=1 Tax=Funneliformis caledonium TaxID=1117310 RepID=A0A9N9EY09_9GLOM|nr:1168_t:CDS:2 [Funneliformis caledonium]
MKPDTYLSSFASNRSVDVYLQNNLILTETEDEVQNWFNDLMLELPKFNKKFIVKDTHVNPYLNVFKLDLSIFLEDDARNKTYISIFVQTLLELLHLLRHIYSLKVFHHDIYSENILLDTDNNSLILADWRSAIRNPPND